MPMMYNPMTGQYYQTPDTAQNPNPNMPQPQNPGYQVGQINFGPQTPPNPAVMQQQPQQQTPHLLGRFIKDISEVKPGEVPMDGTTVIFPLDNYTKIYTKIWGQDGKLYTFAFVPEEPILEAQERQKMSFEEQILQRLDALENRLFPPTTPPKKGKSEG